MTEAAQMRSTMKKTLPEFALATRCTAAWESAATSSLVLACSVATAVKGPLSSFCVAPDLPISR
eukprot:7390235-Prymnesium_polylepis.2